MTLKLPDALFGNKAQFLGEHPSQSGPQHHPAGRGAFPEGCTMQLTSLQPVDVLCVQPQEQPLVMEQPEKVVRGIRLIVPRVQLLGQGEKGLGVVKEEIEFKNGLRVRDVVFLELAIKPNLWRPAKQKQKALRPQTRAVKESELRVVGGWRWRLST